MLPVWVLLQPRDYINGLQLFIGLILLYGAVLIFSPQLVAPAINMNVPEGTPGIMPLLFVTIACGAISGFHGIVSSGTSSKQLDKETDARFVGYFRSEEHTSELQSRGHLVHHRQPHPFPHDALPISRC